MDEGYSTWISNLMTGQVSDAEQAMRAQFRATQAAKPQPAPRTRPIGVAATDANTWAVSSRDDELTTYTLLAGPGRFANCTGK